MLENSLTRVKAMPKYCLTFQIYGGKVDPPFFYPHLTDAHGRCAISYKNVGSGKKKSGLLFVKFIFSFKEKISALPMTNEASMIISDFKFIIHRSPYCSVFDSCC